MHLQLCTCIEDHVQMCAGGLGNKSGKGAENRYLTGMAYLHAANVLHCDLKPANVLLKATSANKRGFICKLADFGMSRLLDITLKTHLSTQTYGASHCLG